MIVRVRAGTTLDELRAAVRGRRPGRRPRGRRPGPGHRRRDSGRRSQRLPAPRARPGARRRPGGHGGERPGRADPVGAPLVKNVTGFDLCRLLVGSLGTLALLGEVVLRCRPAAEVESLVGRRGRRPLRPGRRPCTGRCRCSGTGRRTWVGLAGYEADVRGQAEAVLGPSFGRWTAPPGPPGPACGGRARRATPAGPARRARTGGGWLAEVGVGVVHCTPEVGRPAAARPAPSPSVVGPAPGAQGAIRPGGRLNPGRSALAAVGA